MFFFFNGFETLFWQKGFLGLRKQLIFWASFIFWLVYGDDQNLTAMAFILPVYLEFVLQAGRQAWMRQLRYQKLVNQVLGMLPLTLFVALVASTSSNKYITTYKYIKYILETKYFFLIGRWLMMRWRADWNYRPDSSSCFSTG
jgi:hypothetical protein